MEEDKKKKKNKKKKNKQNKAAESSGNGAGEHINWDQNHVNQTDHKNTGEVHGTTDAQNDVIVMRDGNQLRHVANGPEVVSLSLLYSSLYFSDCCYTYTILLVLLRLKFKLASKIFQLCLLTCIAFCLLFVCLPILVSAL